MSDFDPAFEYVMGWEDPERQYAEVPDSNGYPAISGVNQQYWPKQFGVIQRSPQDERLPLVKDFYHNNFWMHSGIELLACQDLANRVMDMAVNAGKIKAVRLLQLAHAISGGGAKLEPDGILGPKTAAAANADNCATLLDDYRRARATYYESLGGPNLTGWLRRAAA